MKKSIETTTTQVTLRLPQLSYENQNRLVLCESKEACPNCGEITTSHYVKCLEFGLMLYINKDEFDQLLVEDFQHWPVETMFEKFDEDGKLLRKGNLYFSKHSSGTDCITIVSKVNGAETIE